MPLTPGQILNNRYRIVKLLGQGGFGAVYRAWDTNLDEAVAIKESIDTSPAAQRQFKLEAKLLFKLVHPNLPRVHDHFIIPNQGQYLVMDFVEGQDLGEMLKSGPLPEAKVLPWIIQVCDALSYLHSQNPPVIHRDIKPGNIKVTPEGKAMLVDFGISKIFDPNLATTVGARAVTPGYSPPEQYGKGATDIRSDLYALGATLYHLLTGQLPPDSVDIITHSAPPPPPVVDLNAAISEAIGAAITKAMALDRESRWANIQEFKQAITTRPASTKEDVSTAIPATKAISTQHISQPIPGKAELKVPRKKIPWGWLGVIVGLCLLAVTLVLVFVGSILSLRKETIPTSSATGLPMGIPTIQLSANSTLEETQLPAILDADFIDEHGISMKLIPVGDFQMGSEVGKSDENPVHTVYLDAFYMDIYEITNALYAKCVEAGVCLEPSSDEYKDSDNADYPVIYMTWEKAREFCEWRGSRLPTEAEWEKAARGGLEGKLYPWGDESPVCRTGAFINGAKFNDNAGCDYRESHSEPVGSYSPNGFGLFDMVGNVEEWVWDWYSDDYYRQSPTTNPVGPDSGSARVLRGGCWLLNLDWLRVAKRDNADPKAIGQVLGFRCARSADTIPTPTPSP